MTIIKSEDGYTIRIDGGRVDILRAGRLLTFFRREAWDGLGLRMAGELIAAGQIGQYC